MIIDFKQRVAEIEEEYKREVMSAHHRKVDFAEGLTSNKKTEAIVSKSKEEEQEAIEKVRSHINDIV